MLFLEPLELFVESSVACRAVASESTTCRQEAPCSVMVSEVGPDSESTDWAVRGQGRANVVFGYVGTVAILAGKVLRVAKRKTEKIGQHNKHRTLQDAVWAGVPGMLLQDKMVESWNYMHNVIGPVLGKRYVSDGLIVDVPMSLWSGLNLEERGFLLPDSTLFSDSATNGCRVKGPIMSIELKPKCGFLPSCSAENPKGNLPKFALQQKLKLKQGRIDSYSRYNPLDMFSGDPERMKKAFYELLETPQNNLRLFLDGKAVPVGPSGLLDPKVERLVESAIAGSVGKTKAVGWDVLIDMLIRMLLKEGILERILTLQKLDRFDIEGIYPIYQKLIDLSDAKLERLAGLGDDPKCFESTSTDPLLDQCVCERQEGVVGGVGCRTMADNPDARNGSIESNLSCDGSERHVCCGCESWAEYRRLLHCVREYLIAATAKDCSVFLTFQGVCEEEKGNGDTCGEGGIGSYGDECRLLDLGNERVLYKVVVADLDIKHVSKIPHHFSIDRTIQDLFKGLLNKEKITGVVE